MIVYVLPGLLPCAVYTCVAFWLDAPDPSPNDHDQAAEQPVICWIVDVSVNVNVVPIVFPWVYVPLVGLTVKLATGVGHTTGDGLGLGEADADGDGDGDGLLDGDGDGVGDGDGEAEAPAGCTSSCAIDVAASVTFDPPVNEAINGVRTWKWPRTLIVAVSPSAGELGHAMTSPDESWHVSVTSVSETV